MMATAPSLSLSSVLPTLSTLFPSSQTLVYGIAPNEIWMVVTGFVVAFVLAFGIGANDVANSFGTSVGSKVLTLLRALILATIFETLGAVLLGAKVSDTIRKEIVDLTYFEDTVPLFLVGNISVLIGACVWLIIATFFRLPVSGTHSTVGAYVGFALVAHGAKGVHWDRIALVVASWFISPFLAGIISVCIFYLLNKFIITKEDQLTPGLKVIPFIYGASIFINIFSIFYEGSGLLHFDKIPIWGVLILSIGAAASTAVVIHFFCSPKVRRDVAAEKEAEHIRQEIIRTMPEHHQGSMSIHKEIMPQRRRSSINTEVSDGVFTNMNADSKSLPGDVAFMEETVFSGDEPITRPQPMRSIAPVPRPSLPSISENDNRLQYYDPRGPGFRSTYNRHSSQTDQFARTADKGIQVDLINAQDKVVKMKSSRGEIKDSIECTAMFSFLQILTAVFGSFAHGGNDVSNAIGPLIALWVVSTERSVQQESDAPVWILFYGSAGICVGLWIWGRRVIKTLGEDLTKITPSSGFCIEIGSALTVLLASNIGIPISTTHCKVGAVVCTGRFRSKENVDWRVFRNIVFAWIVTLPVSGGLAAGAFATLRMFVE